MQDLTMHLHLSIQVLFLRNGLTWSQGTVYCYVQSPICGLASNAPVFLLVWAEQTSPCYNKGKVIIWKKSRLNCRTAKTGLSLVEEHLSRWEYRCSMKCVFNDLCHMCSYTDWYTSTAISRGTLGLMRRKMYACIYWALNFSKMLISIWSSSWVLSGLSIMLKNTSGPRYETTVWNAVRGV